MMMCNIESYPPITPRLYEICQSLVGTPDGSTPPLQVASLAAPYIFDFEYTLSNKLNKTDFQTNLLNHFLMRRIGLETYAYWKLKLRDKLLTILPSYNLLFDMLYSDVFGDKVTQTQDNYNSQFTDTGSTSNTSTATNSNTLTPNTVDTVTTDNRMSDTPQDSISDVQNGSYVSEYSYITNKTEHEGSDVSITNSNTSTNTGTTNVNEHTGTDIHTTIENLSAIDKLSAIKNFNENLKDLMTNFYNELEDLFLMFE